MDLDHPPYLLQVIPPARSQLGSTHIYIKPGAFQGTGARAMLIQQMSDWCRTCLGPEDLRWSHPTTRSWLFSDPKDAMLFKLRWTP